MKNLSLAHKLRELRLAHNYNQDEVAIALNVARQTYSHYETGNRTPSENRMNYQSNVQFNLIMLVSPILHITVTT